MDDRLLDKLETDIRYVDPNLLPNSPILPGDTPNTFKDSYGKICYLSQPYYYAGTGVLSTIQPGDDIDNHVTFPNPEDTKWIKGVAQRAKSLQEKSNHFVTIRMVASQGPFQTACDLRGTEIFLMDMGPYPEFAQELLTGRCDHRRKTRIRQIAPGGGYVLVPSNHI